LRVPQVPQGKSRPAERENAIKIVRDKISRSHNSTPGAGTAGKIRKFAEMFRGPAFIPDVSMTHNK